MCNCTFQPRPVPQGFFYGVFMSVKLAMRNRDNAQLGYTEAQTGGYIIFLPNGDTYHVCSADFRDKYTPLPEAPEVGSTAWAWQMLEQGEKICRPFEMSDCKYLLLDGKYIMNDMGEKNLNISRSYNDWQLYAPPKPIVELLPHEFVEGQEVLAKSISNQVLKEFPWIKRKFSSFCDQGYICTSRDGIQRCYEYCLPYEGNEHLEGQITDGEHGAVPRGYVPPHVPKLGDEEYWMVGDEVINLSIGKIYTIKEFLIDDVLLDPLTSKGKTLIVPLSIMNGKHYNDIKIVRIWYHYRSNVNNDGTVHEHIPTRPHRIED